MGFAGRGLPKVLVLCIVVGFCAVGPITPSLGAAGASPGATCSGTFGAINSILVNNGVAGPGLRLARMSPQQFRATASHQTCTGGFVTAARTKMVATTLTGVNCQTIRQTLTRPGVPLAGTGTFTWTAPAGMGTSMFNIRWLWIKNTMIHFSGSVTAGGSAKNLFRGLHVSGNIVTRQSLAARAAGGDCSATIPLTHFDITKIVYLIH